jgi:peptidoglycan/xylan/chitin deacetylase (PgdA/CDA1 family)
MALSSRASADVAAGTNVYRIPTSERVCAITLDDRLNSAYARSILATLKSNNATATFFTLGQSLRDYPGLSRDIVAAGCRIGNHSYGHISLVGATVLYQVRETELAAVYAGIPDPTPLFRAPFGSSGKVMLSALKSEGYANVLWTVSAGDTGHGATAKSVTAAVLDHLTPGCIILMHGSLKTTPDALPAILAGIKARGYRVVDLYSALYPYRAAAVESGPDSAKGGIVFSPGTVYVQWEPNGGVTYWVTDSRGILVPVH